MTQAAPRLPAGFKQATPGHEMFLRWLVKAKELTRCTKPRAPYLPPTSDSIALCHFFTRFLSRQPLLNPINRQDFFSKSYCLFKLKQKVQGSSQQKPVKIAAKLSTQWLKNVALKSANVLQEGLMVLCYVMSDCWSWSLQLSAHIPRVPPVWQEQTTEQCFQEHGTSDEVCSQAALQEWTAEAASNYHAYTCPSCLSWEFAQISSGMHTVRFFVLPRLFAASVFRLFQ